MFSPRKCLEHSPLVLYHYVVTARKFLEHPVCFSVFALESFEVNVLTFHNLQIANMPQLKTLVDVRFYISCTIFVCKHQYANEACAHFYRLFFFFFLIFRSRSNVFCMFCFILSDSLEFLSV